MIAHMVDHNSLDSLLQAMVTGKELQAMVTGKELHNIEFTKETSVRRAHGQSTTAKLLL